MDNDCNIEEPEVKKMRHTEKPANPDTVLPTLETVKSESNEISCTFDFPPDSNISSMLDDVDFKNGFLSVTDRYFTPYYRVDTTKLENDTCIWIHSNRICMISLAPSHKVFKSDRIVSVNFKVSEKLDRRTNVVSGKSKHGAQPLQENSNLCTITTSNDEVHVIKCGMIGKLVEVNETLLENPELLRDAPHKGGYLIIMLLNIKLMDKMMKSLLNKEKYDEFLTNRKDNDTKMSDM